MSRSRSSSSSSADSCGPGGLFSSSIDPEFDDPSADPSRELLFANISVNATPIDTKTFLNRITFHYVYNKMVHIESHLEHRGEAAISRERNGRVLVCIGLSLFFAELYSHVLLEFLQASRLPAPELRVDGDDDIDKGVISQSDCSDTLGAVDRASSLLHKKQREQDRTHSLQRHERVLVPLGGGKDSLVTLDLALEAGASVSLLYVADGMDEFEHSWRLCRMVEMNPGIPMRIVKHDFIDERFERSARSFLQPTGHPWAALVLFDALLVCELYSINRVHLGFERSADEGNGVFLHGKEINHQYDKSSAFLQRFKSFVPLLRSKPLGSSNNDGGGALVYATERGDGDGDEPSSSMAVVVESPLADMWDLEVAKLFCTKPSLRRYHDVFISCNESDGLQNWCMKCEKCAFVYLVFSAWLDPEEVARVFGGVDMFAGGDAAREHSLLSLVRRGAPKPYECVGTRWECRAAVELALRRRALLAGFKEQVDAKKSNAALDVPVVLARMCAEVFDLLDIVSAAGGDHPQCLSLEALCDLAWCAACNDEQSIIDRWLARTFDDE